MVNRFTIVVILLFLAGMLTGCTETEIKKSDYPHVQKLFKRYTGVDLSADFMILQKEVGYGLGDYSEYYRLRFPDSLFEALRQQLLATDPIEWDKYEENWSGIININTSEYVTLFLLEHPPEISFTYVAD